MNARTLIIQSPVCLEEWIGMDKWIQLLIILLSLFIHDNLLVENSVGSVKIHNPTLIERWKENTGDNAKNDKIPLEQSPFVSPLFESVPSVEPPRFQCWWRRWFRTCDGLQGIAPYLQNRMCFFLTSSMRHPREIALFTNLNENAIFPQPLV